MIPSWWGSKPNRAMVPNQITVKTNKRISLKKGVLNREIF
jgi:hypothetical protein